MLHTNESADRLRDIKYEKMTTQPVGPLILKMALPAMLSIMISAFYNLADTWFVSHVGEGATRAVAALGVIFSYQMMSNAIGFFFGHGSGNYISRALGRRERDKAAEMASTGAFSSFIFGTILAIIALAFTDPILLTLGASHEILPEAREYFFFIAFSTPFLTTQLSLNNQLRLQGNARLGMIGIASGAILNIVLDALFIFGFHWGISGASLATAISQVVGCCTLFAMTHVGDGLPPKLKNFRPTLANYREILAGGLPSLSRQALNAVAAVVLNRYAIQYGADPLAALSIVSKLFHLVVCVAIGIGQGFQPVCGFNFGARLFDRVREAFFFGVKASTIVMTVGFFLLYFGAAEIIDLFGSSREAAVIASRTVRYYAFSLPFLGFIIMTEMFYQNTRQTFGASLLAMMRQGIALIPAIVILDYFFSLEGVLWSQPLANFLSLFVAIPFAISLLRKIQRGMV
ncbi:MAG: MATE family efflux transporter [Proteobacteria bacterium]|nr:MATE family efflux transporter [Pseudomonadota bacterium]